MNDRTERRLSAVLAVDLVGYSSLMAADETGTLASIKDHRQKIFAPKSAAFRGRLVKLIGDGMLMEFASVLDAVSFAIDVQTTLGAASTEQPADRQFAYRIGINIGDIIVDGDDIYGNGVNVAARLEALAPPGGICVSANVHDQIKSRFGGEFELLGPQTLKNIAEPVDVWSWSSRSNPDAPVRKLALPDRPSIAVLPFANMSADTSQAYIADGITEEIITSLSKCRWIFVIARNSAFLYRGEGTESRKVSEELGVRYLLEGSIRKAGERIRITTHLIDTERGGHLWAERYDRAFTDIFELQDELAQCVVAALEPTLKKAELERVQRKRPGNLDAYDLYLRALQRMYEVRPESRALALEFAQQALGIDPNYAEAHGVAAWCYFAKSLWEGSLPDPHKEAMLFHARAVQELAVEDASTLAHAAMGIALSVRDYDAALAMIDRAIANNPSSAHAHGHGSVINTWAGNYARSIQLSDMALRLSPYDPLSVMPLAGQAGAWLMQQDYENAISFAKRALQVYPNHSPSFLIAIASLVRLGRLEEASSTACEMMRAFPSYRIIPKAPVLEHFVDELRQAGLPG